MKKLTASVLALAFILCLFGCETNFEIEKTLMEKGPWSREAVWIDEDAQMYLICTKDNNSQYADAAAYWSVGGQWVSAKLNLYQGAPIVSFVTEDGERVIEARAKMNGQNLQLYKFKTYNEEFTPQDNDIELS